MNLIYILQGQQSENIKIVTELNMNLNKFAIKLVYNEQAVNIQVNIYVIPDVQIQEATP